MATLMSSIGRGRKFYADFGLSLETWRGTGIRRLGGEMDGDYAIIFLKNYGIMEAIVKRIVGLIKCAIE